MNSPRPRLAPWAALCLAASLTLSACGGDDSPEKSSGSGDQPAAAELGLKDPGKIVVCGDVPFRPFEEEDPTSPTGYKGFDVDISQEIADGLGVELEFKDATFDTLQSGLALNSGQCDMSASGMTITEDRKKEIAFSDGYYDSLQSLLVPKDSDVKELGDLNGKKIAVQQGSTGSAYAEKKAEGAELVYLPSDAEMFQALQGNQVDAILQDLPVNLDHTKDGEYAIVAEYDTGEEYGLAIKKDNTKLVEAVNAELQEIRDSGRYQEIYDSYFAESE